MFNSVNNPFGQRIESAISTGQEQSNHQQEQQKNEEKKYLENDDKDEVQISGQPNLSEDDVLELTKSYIAKLKEEHSQNKKAVEKLEKYLQKFNAKKFLKENPNLTYSEFYMVMYNETEHLTK